MFGFRKIGTLNTIEYSKQLQILPRWWPSVENLEFIRGFKHQRQKPKPKQYFGKTPNYDPICTHVTISSDQA
jgi:hypothetical protein